MKLSTVNFILAVSNLVLTGMNAIAYFALSPLLNIPVCVLVLIVGLMVASAILFLSALVLGAVLWIQGR